MRSCHYRTGRRMALDTERRRLRSARAPRCNVVGPRSILLTHGAALRTRQASRTLFGYYCTQTYFIHRRIADFIATLQSTKKSVGSVPSVSYRILLWTLTSCLLVKTPSRRQGPWGRRVFGSMLPSQRSVGGLHEVYTSVCWMDGRSVQQPALTIWV